MRERPAIKRPHQASGGGREGIYSRHFDACGPSSRALARRVCVCLHTTKKRHQALAEGVRDRLAIKRPHQRSGGGCVFAAGKYGKAGILANWFDLRPDSVHSRHLRHLLRK